MLLFTKGKGSALIKVLTRIIDGSGVHDKDTVLKYSAEEEARLIKLGAAVYVDKASSSEKATTQKTPDNGASDADSVEGEVITEEEYQEMLDDLCKVNGIDQAMAESLFDSGIETVEDLANAIPESLTKIKGIGKATAPKIIKSAKGLL